MSAVDALRYRLHVLRRVLFDRAAWRRELDAELAHHLELDAMQRRHAGQSDAEARRGARASLGSPARVRERIVDDSGASALDALAQDLRFAGRALRARPAFTAVAVLTLAVGIGANVAIFSAVDAMLLRRLPFREPERLMKVSLTMPARGDTPALDDMVWSYPKFVAFRDAQTSYADLGVYAPWQATLRGDVPERVRAEMTDDRYLPTLGVQPALGRGFARDEARAGAAPRVLLGDALWRRRFAADSGIVGRAIDLGGTPYTVVGVLPPGFRGLTGRAELWLPAVAANPGLAREAGVHAFALVARRKAGVTEARAIREVQALGRRVDELYPDEDVKGAHWGAVARPLDARRVDPLVRRALYVLLGAVGLVLLVACANVANLLLVRAAGRQREIAVRVALGAGRGRLVRQLLTESVLLASLGGAAGVAVAWWGVRALAALDPARAPRFSSLLGGGLGAVGFDLVRLDGTALAVAAAMALGTGILFGLAPALHVTRHGTRGAQAHGGSLRTARDGGPRATRLRGLLAGAEVALALVLLAGAGLMLKSLGNLLAVRQGFDAHGVLTLAIGWPEGIEERALPAYRARLVERVAALPGVAGVAMADCVPLSGGCNRTVIKLLDRPPAPAGAEPDVGVHWISPDWPALMRVPLLRGRALGDEDRAGGPLALLVSETAARRFWPDDDPIGKPVRVGVGRFWTDTAYVVGVVGDVRYATPDSQPRAEAYVSYAQAPPGAVTLFVRAAPGIDPLALATPARRAANALAPDSPVHAVRTLAERVGEAMAFARFGALLLALFAAAALALATLGVYGVVAFAAAQRTREIGVRVALGATRRDVVRLVVGHGLAIVAAGGVVGVAGALAATRLLRAMLYDVAPGDPATFAAIGLVLAGAALVASWLPARRAARVAPTEALRAD